MAMAGAAPGGVAALSEAHAAGGSSAESLLSLQAFIVTLLGFLFASRTWLLTLTAIWFTWKARALLTHAQGSLGHDADAR